MEAPTASCLNGAPGDNKVRLLLVSKVLLPEHKEVRGGGGGGTVRQTRDGSAGEGGGRSSFSREEATEMLQRSLFLCPAGSIRASDRGGGGGDGRGEEEEEGGEEEEEEAALQEVQEGKTSHDL